MAKNNNFPKSKIFAMTLRRQRKQFNLAQQDVADYCKVCRQSISDYETGQTIPDIDTAQLIVQYFNSYSGENRTIDWWLSVDRLKDKEPMNKRILINKIQSAINNDKLDEIDKIIKYYKENCKE